MSSSNEQLYRRIIMDHYRNPRNKGLVKEVGYVTVHLRNPSCGDDLTVQLKADHDCLAEVRQEGSGCSICCSSASMMTELLQGDSLSEATAKIASFRQMIEGETYDEDVLGDAVSLQGVSQLPQRVKCAMLAWKACEQGIDLLAQKAAGQVDPTTNRIESLNEE